MPLRRVCDGYGPGMCRVCAGFIYIWAGYAPSLSRVRRHVARQEAHMGRFEEFFGELQREVPQSPSTPPLHTVPHARAVTVPRARSRSSE